VNSLTDGPGAAYLFELNTSGQWIETRKFRPSAIEPAEDMGRGVALGRGYAVAGDHHYRINGQYMGAVFAFELPIGESICTGQSNSLGAGSDLQIHGSPVAEGGALRLTARTLPVGQAGMFLASQATAYQPGAGGSQGDLCLGGAILRFNGPGQIGVADDSGENSIWADLSHLPYGQGQSALAGQTWNFQYWYRDQNPGPESNFSETKGLVLD